MKVEFVEVVVNLVGGADGRRVGALFTQSANILSAFRMLWSWLWSSFWPSLVLALSLISSSMAVPLIADGLIGSACAASRRFSVLGAVSPRIRR